MTADDARTGAWMGARPTVDEVALLIRARTKDALGNEVGTFDEDTRPTGDQVDEQITAAAPLVWMRLPPIDSLPSELVPAVASLVAYRAALRIEKSFFPEQVRSDRSAYDQLLAEYVSDLAALIDAIHNAATSGDIAGETGGPDIAVIPVGSWTSIDERV